MKNVILKFPESVNILKALLEDIPTAVVIVDRSFIVRMHNKAFVNIFTDNNKKSTGRLCGNAINCSYAVEEGCDCGSTSKCSHCNLRNSFIQTLAKKEIIREKISKTTYQNNKETKRHFYYTTKFVLFEHEEMIMVLIDDITELEEKNRALSELNEKKNEFMRIAAHDIRNPISSIYTFSDLLISSSSELPEKKKQEFLNHIKNSARFSISLLNDLLDFSVLESGNSKLKVSKNDYIELVKHVTETYRYIAAPKNITISLFTHLKIEDIYYDADRIEQLLHNLLSNAVKFSPLNSEISVRITKSKNFLTTSVSDNGPGIEKDDLEKIFKPFHKSSAPTTGGEKSTGLGLSICKLITHQHNGEIWVESIKGHGSAFYFKLPIHLI